MGDKLGQTTFRRHSKNVVCPLFILILCKDADGADMILHWATQDLIEDLVERDRLAMVEFLRRINTDGKTRANYVKRINGDRSRLESALKTLSVPFLQVRNDYEQWCIKGNRPRLENTPKM